MSRNILIGTLKPGGGLETPEGRLLLTRIQRQTAQPPESAPLMVPQEQVGRLAVVRGVRDGGAFHVAPGANAQVIGSQIAQAVYGGLGR